MTVNRQRIVSPVSWLPVGLGLLVAGAVFAGIRLTPPAYLADFPPLLQQWLADELVLAGQALGLGLLLILLLLLVVLLRRARQVGRLQRSHQNTWASRAWALAHHLPPAAPPTPDHLERARLAMERALNARWRPLYLLCLLPAGLGLLAGQLRLLAHEGPPLPFLDYYLPLCLAVGEGVLTLLIVIRLRRLGSWVLEHWLQRTRELEGLTPVPGGSQADSAELLPLQSGLLAARASTVGGPPARPSGEENPPRRR